MISMSPGSITVVTTERHITRRALLLRDGIEVVGEIIKMFVVIRERQREPSLPTKSLSLWSRNSFCVWCLLSFWELGSLCAAE